MRFMVWLLAGAFAMAMAGVLWTGIIFIASAFDPMAAVVATAASCFGVGYMLMGMDV